jgi:hypothetical protein
MATASWKVGGVSLSLDDVACGMGMELLVLQATWLLESMKTVAGRSLLELPYSSIYRALTW